RRGKVQHHGTCRRCRQDRWRRGGEPRWYEAVHRAGTDRHAEGARVLPARRHPALRAAQSRRREAGRLTAPGTTGGARPVAIFDLDGTITRGDTLRWFVFAQLRRHPARLLRLWALPLQLLDFARTRDHGRLKARVLRAVLSGLPRA